MRPVLGKPADYGQFLLTRRYNLARLHVLSALQFQNFYIDVGCGNGAQTILFASHFKRALALDVEEERLQVFRDTVQRHGAGGCDLRIACYDGAQIPADDNSANFITCIEVLEHTTSDTATIAELYRVLKPGGAAVITVPNKWWIFETHGAHLPLLPWNRVPLFSWLPEPIHSKYAKARIYRKSKIEAMLESAGFRIYRSLYVTAPMDMIRQPVLQKLVRSLLFRKDETALPILSTSIMSIVTKS